MLTICIHDADDVLELAAIVQQVLHELGKCDCDPDLTQCVEELV